jgi:hypothetical protein
MGCFTAKQADDDTLHKFAVRTPEDSCVWQKNSGVELDCGMSKDVAGRIQVGTGAAGRGIADFFSLMIF